MPENLFLEFDAFLRSIKQNLDGSFGVLLGAGASISSGIQSANDCIWDWKFLIYQSLSGNQKKLVELDENGLPTGYLVRKRNYGRFNNDYKQFLK